MRSMSGWKRTGSREGAVRSHRLWTVSVPYADKVITEITCHGKGAWKLFGKDGVVIDIGGQDTKKGSY